MPNYYTIVEGGLRPKFVAQSEDINAIQSHIETALVDLVVDNLGNAFVLSDEDDAFELTALKDLTTETIDQQNPNGAIDKFTKDLYLRQKISINKSSIDVIKVKLKNTYTEDITATFEIRDINDDILGSSSVEVPALSAYVEYPLSFEIDHLPKDDFYLIMKRTNIGTDSPYVGVFALIDTDGTYNGSLCESGDGNFTESEELGYDLWFKEYFGTQSTFLVNRALALIKGNKIYSLDTHVNIPPASAYGDRIDVVVMNRFGEYSVVEGDVVLKNPTEPEVDEDLLVLAYIKVFKNSPQAVDMEVDQSEILGRTRLRSLKHRIRDLEVMSQWMMDNNSPERVKYNLSGEAMFNSSASTDIIWDPDASSYIIDSAPKVRTSLSFKDDTGFTATNIDHTDHSEGKVTLGKKQYSQRTWDSGHEGKPRKVFTHRLLTYKDRRYTSRFPAGWFYVSEEGYLDKIGIDIRFHVTFNNQGQMVPSMSGGKLYVYRKGYHLLESSNWVSSSTWKQPPNYTLPEYSFGGNTWFKKGWYYWVLIADPIYSVGKLWVNSWYSYDSAIGKARKNDTFMIMNGRWPSPYNLYYTSDPGQGISSYIRQIIPGYESSGTITSDALATDAGIATVKVDMNLTLPSETYYTLEVSNDGGTTYYKMAGTNYNFTSTTGRSFKWRLKLFTNNTEKTPILKYDANDQYAIRFTLGLTGGSPATSGQLVSTTFYGPGLLEYVLGYENAIPVSATHDLFSHWEWLRFWGEENSGEISVDFESSDDGSAWTVIKSGLSLEDIGQNPTLFGESVDFDEYNYRTDVDTDLLTDSEVIDSGETYESWESDQTTNVVITESTSVPSSPADSTSVKFAMGADATTGLLAHRTHNFSFLNYEEIHINVLSSIDLDEGDVQLVLGGDETCTTELETFDLPAVANGTTNAIQFTFRFDDPSDLGEVKSIGIKQVVDKGAFDFYIDSISVIKVGLTMLEDCEVAWTETTAKASYITVTAATDQVVQGTKSAKIAITNYGSVGTGLLTYKPKSPTLDLTNFKQFRFWIRASGVALNNGDAKIVFSEEADCSVELQTYNIPTITVDEWKVVTIDIENPEELENVASIGFALTSDVYGDAGSNGNIWIDAIEGITSLETPFYQDYVRFIFNLSRELPEDLSPSIRKIGVIPQLK